MSIVTKDLQSGLGVGSGLRLVLMSRSTKNVWDGGRGSYVIAGRLANQVISCLGWDHLSGSSCMRPAHLGT
jgi:hypothetical protein